MSIYRIYIEDAKAFMSYILFVSIVCFVEQLGEISRWSALDRIDSRQLRPGGRFARDWVTKGEGKGKVGRAQPHYSRVPTALNAAHGVEWRVASVMERGDATSWRLRSRLLHLHSGLLAARGLS